MDPVNLFDVEVPTQAPDARPEGFRRERLQIGPLLGAARIGATLYELPPGERIAPYHYEYNNEEWLLVLEGRLTLRTPTGERELRAGDVLAFPEGPAGAHGAFNGTDERVRVLMLSTKRVPAVAVYPDSDKLAVWRLGNEEDDIVVERSSRVEYWTGELP